MAANFIQNIRNYYILMTNQAKMSLFVANYMFSGSGNSNIVSSFVLKCSKKAKIQNGRQFYLKYKKLVHFDD